MLMLQYVLRTSKTMTSIRQRSEADNSTLVISNYYNGTAYCFPVTLECTLSSEPTEHVSLGMLFSNNIICTNCVLSVHYEFMMTQQKKLIFNKRLTCKVKSHTKKLLICYKIASETLESCLRSSITEGH